MFELKNSKIFTKGQDTQSIDKFPIAGDSLSLNVNVPEIPRDELRQQVRKFDQFDKDRFALSKEDGSSEQYSDSNNPDGLSGDLTICQGMADDCSVSASIYSLSKSTVGTKLLDYMVKPSSDGCLVRFPRHEEGVSCCKVEVSNQDLESVPNLLSNAPSGVKAIEIARAKLIRKERNDNLTKAPHWKNYLNSEPFGAATLTRITGQESQFSNSHGLTPENWRKYVAEQLAAISSSGQDVAMLAVGANPEELKEELGISLKYYPGKDVPYAQLSEGREFPVVSGHTHSAVDINAKEQTITLVNPWDTSRKFPMKWKDFANVVKQFSLVPLGEGRVSKTLLENNHQWMRRQGITPSY